MTEEVISTSTHSSIKTFHLEHTWTIDGAQEYVKETGKERFIESTRQQSPHFKYYLRLHNEPPAVPFVELHLEALKEITFEVNYKVSLLDKEGKDVTGYLLDWTSKGVKLNEGKAVIYPGIDIKSAAEIFNEGKLTIHCEIKYVAEKVVAA